MVDDSRSQKILISDWWQVGGEMADAEAQALVKAADKDGNQGIDFGEFAQLWQALHGEDEVGSRDFISG